MDQTLGENILKDLLCLTDFWKLTHTAIKSTNTINIM